MESLLNEPYEPPKYSFISFEGYLNAKLFVAILERMGDSPSRANLSPRASRTVSW